VASAWHSAGQSVYRLVCASLKDDYEGVRLTAVKLVWVFCQIYPEQLVALHSLPSCCCVWFTCGIMVLQKCVLIYWLVDW